MTSLSRAAEERATSPRVASRDVRRKAILGIAREMFLTRGFAATSMSGVAARLGGSKGTLYNYFSSKEELFEAVVKDDCELEFLAMTDFQPIREIDESLRRFGVRFLRYLLSETALSYHRLLTAESARFPDLGRLFYAAGPDRTVERLSEFLSAAMEAGKLRSFDPEAAASFLMGLLKANLHHRRVWNVRMPSGTTSIETHVEQAVDIFLNGLAC